MKTTFKSFIAVVIVAMTMTGCHKVPINPGTVPGVTTTAASGITKTSATLSGDVTDNGGHDITARGVYFSLIDPPTDKSSQKDGGQGSGVFTCTLVNLNLNTTYYYMAYATNSMGTSFGGVKSFTTVNRDASVTIKGDSALTLNSVKIKMEIVPYGSTIIEVGVVFGTSLNPTTSNSKITSNITSGTSTISLNGLNSNTKYYIRAYAVTNSETIYSSEIEIWTYGLMDIDGNGYYTVKIGNYEFTVENLRTTHYRNGDPIPVITGNLAWHNATSGARCYYDNDSAKYDSTYGALYNFYTIVDPRGLVPPGWHVPSYQEWGQLWRDIGKPKNLGGMMKEAGTSHWQAPNTDATNSTGFTGLPGGDRGDGTDGKLGAFYAFGYYAGFWTSTKEPALPGDATIMELFYNLKEIGIGGAAPYDYGYSIRLMKNR